MKQELELEQRSRRWGIGAGVAAGAEELELEKEQELQQEHKIIKRKNGKQKQSLIIWLIFFLFLQTKPSFCRLFAWSRLDFSAIPVSFSAVSLGYTLIYFQILRLLNGAVSSLTHSSNPRNVKQIVVYTYAWMP